MFRLTDFSRVRFVKLETFPFVSLRESLLRLLSEHALPSLVRLDIGSLTTNSQVDAVLATQRHLERLDFTFAEDGSGDGWIDSLCAMPCLRSLSIRAGSKTAAIYARLISSMPALRAIVTEFQLVDDDNCMMLALVQRRARFGDSPNVAMEDLCLVLGRWLAPSADIPSLLNLVQVALCVETDEQLALLCGYLCDESLECQWRRLSLTRACVAGSVDTGGVALFSLLLCLPLLEILTFGIERTKAVTRSSADSTELLLPAPREAKVHRLRELALDIDSAGLCETEEPLLLLVVAYLNARAEVLPKLSFHVVAQQTAFAFPSVGPPLMLAAATKCEALSVLFPLASLVAAFEDLNASSERIVLHDLDLSLLGHRVHGQPILAETVFTLAATILRVAPSLSKLCVNSSSSLWAGPTAANTDERLSEAICAHRALRTLRLPLWYDCGLKPAASESPTLEFFTCGAHTILRNVKRQMQAKQAHALWMGVAIAARIAVLDGPEARHLGGGAISFVPRIVALASDDELSLNTEEPDGAFIERYTARFASSRLCAALADSFSSSRKRKHT